MSNIHEQFMKEAIAEALKAKGKTGENPIVGAVIVESGKIAARDHHKFFGGPHAEIECLKAFNEGLVARSSGLGRDSQRRVTSQRDLTLYVTLEPCCTVGKTGKCTDAILASGIKKVIVGAIDPNPNHRGKGIEILKAAGIQVIAGVLAKECENLNPEFNQRMNNSSKIKDQKSKP